MLLTARRSDGIVYVIELIAIVLEKPYICILYTIITKNFLTLLLTNLKTHLL